MKQASLLNLYDKNEQTKNRCKSKNPGEMLERDSKFDIDFFSRSYHNSHEI